MSEGDFPPFMFISPSDIKVKNMSFLLPGLLINSAVRGQKKLKASQADTYKVYQPGQHGSAYQNLADQNPYANVTYRQSWIQKLMENLGFRTSKDAYLESMALQAKEYDNQIAQKEYNETYDSPVAQAQREKLAGLNPNLTGNVSAGESQAPVDDGNPPVAPVADDLDIVQNFASGILNGVQAAFGLYGQLQSITGLRLGNESNMMNLVKSAWSMIIPDWYENRNDSQEARIDVSNYYNSLKRHFGHTMSKKNFDNFVNRVNAFANSAEGWQMVYDTQTKKAKARKSMFQEISDPDSYSEWDDIMSVVGDELGSLAFDTTKKTMQNSKEYQEGYSGAERAANEKQSSLESLHAAKNANELSDYQVNLRKSLQSILGKLDKLENKGNKVAPIVKAVLSVWLMGMMPSLPGFSR